MLPAETNAAAWVSDPQPGNEYLSREASLLGSGEATCFFTSEMVLSTKEGYQHDALRQKDPRHSSEDVEALICNLHPKRQFMP